MGAETTSGKRAASKPADVVTVILVGASHGAQAGASRAVSAETAASLVDRGLARYPIG